MTTDNRGQKSPLSRIHELEQERDHFMDQFLQARAELWKQEFHRFLDKYEIEEQKVAEQRAKIETLRRRIHELEHDENQK